MSFGGLTEEDAQFAATLAVRLIFMHASQFHRRVTEVLNEYPYKIFLLIKEDPTKPCRLRMDLASEILSSRDDCLHIVARKVKQLYTQDLVTASQTGILPAWLSLALDEVSRNWHADTRENERAAWMNWFLSVLFRGVV